MTLRKVYNASYEVDGHFCIFLDPPDVLGFALRSLRYCIGPDAYCALVEYPNAQEIVKLSRRVQRVFRGDLDISRVHELIDIVNSSTPLSSLERAMAKSPKTTATDECYFAAARFLRNNDRMRRLKDEYKAHRINRLFKSILRNRVPDDPIKCYSIEALYAVCWHIKQQYLPNRRLYEKK